MIRIAVCDDEQIFLDLITSHLIDILNDASIEAKISKYKSSVLLFHRHAEDPFDILFLDIDVPELSGFQLAEKIRSVSSNTIIVFITGKHELVYHCFDYQPFDFICKRSNYELYQDLKRTVRKLTPAFRQSITIEISDYYMKSRRIPVGNLLYVKSEKHYLHYYVISSESIPSRERSTISSKEPELKELGFIKPHQRYLVNMYHIQRFDTILNTIILSDRTTIPVSKSFHANAFESYKNFKRR